MIERGLEPADSSFEDESVQQVLVTQMPQLVGDDCRKLRLGQQS